MPLRDYFCFGGKSSLDFGISVSEPPKFSAPRRAITTQYIPGGGAILQDDGYWEDIACPYKTWVKTPDEHEAPAWARALKGWLLSRPGEYQLLEDSYDPDYVRYAYCADSLEISVASKKYIQQTIQFVAKPMLYRRDGLMLRELTANRLYNPESFTSFPCLKIYGSGDIELSANNGSWTLEGIDGYIVMDSSRRETYKDTAALNDHKTGAGYPELSPGWNTLTWTGNVQKIEIMPRWCCL